MKLEYLKEFLVLSQVGNYTAAAEEIYVSESTLSRHMMQLEKELRTTLFLRSAKGVRLTEAGTLLLPYARSVSETLDNYAAALEGARLAKQRLTIGFAHCLLQYGMAEHLFRFRREHPEIEMVMTEDKSESLWRMAQSGECDFIFCYHYDNLDAAGLKLSTLLTDTLALVVPESHPLSQRGSAPLSLLKNDHFLMQSRTSTMFKNCSRLLREAGCDLRNVTLAGSMNLDMVAQGMGVALMEKRRYLPSAPGNVRFLDLEPPVEKDLVMAYRDRLLSPQAQLFLQFVREYMG